ncbi:MAG: hypothetical protein KDJ52_28970 [Anaerolineae bacterium]|nr:hypothetical protein [Anaerolineae bacterium]
MNKIADYQTQRNRFWPDIDHFFANLPPHLFRQGVMLKNNLATFHADTGQFRDILAREDDPPLFYAHLWLLDDWRMPASAERTRLEKHLFVAAVFNFAAVSAEEALLDEGSNVDNSTLFLAQSLRRQADFHLAHLFPSSSPFWGYHQTLWLEDAEARLAALQASDDAATLSAEQMVTHLPTPLAYTKMPSIGAALGAGLDDHIPSLHRLLDHLNSVWQIVRDIATLRHDIARRRYSYPLLKTIQAAKLDAHQPLAPEQLLGALALTGVMHRIGQTCAEQLDAARNLADALALPSFKAHCDTVEKRVQDIVDLFSLKNVGKKQAETPQKIQRPIFAPFVDTVPTVITMAEGYLLADQSFRESWEIQRRGVFGLPEMVAQAFPAGFIIEILSRHGHALAQPIDTVFQTLRATGFRYYNHDHLPPDTDDLGLALRLWAYSAQPENHRQILQAPLEQLLSTISDSGDIPVWLMSNAQAETPYNVSLWGNHCAAVTANVLLGLINYDRVGYQALIEKCARKLLTDIRRQGVAAGWHYVPLYTIWIVFELAAQLQAQSMANILAEDLDAAVHTLATRFDIEVQRQRVTPQDAALLTLISLSSGAPDTVKAAFNPDWITLLGQTQRYDGSWPGEPLYGTPTRGELAAWYASNSATTVLCYHALKTYTSK